MAYEDDYAKLAQRFRYVQQRRRARVVCCDWMGRTGLAYWFAYLLHEPRDFAFTVPRRLACRLLRRHNLTCIGRRNHPRRW